MACYRAKTKVANGIALFILMIEMCSEAKTLYLVTYIIILKVSP
ncbi:protein of unknown function [Shewanella benthica]|uniref:Uncharacterized protein n=1 Tax=Shewanella benthica TaxID=43661 RepID=A0A330M6M8_9GAMM|nr:protein of unknown function [Shewanella benthica]